MDYKQAFNELIEAGVPRWYIRLYLIDNLAYVDKVFVYYDPYDIEAEHGWYAKTRKEGNFQTEADKNRKCYGSLEYDGFPEWEDYRLLFDGDEYDDPNDFEIAYEQHRNEFIEKWVERV